jgi:NAD(P)-dependent dehydrogenase (short-subunit alcohol dehydrogenase family)
VVVTARTDKEIVSAEQEIRAMGGQALAIAADLSKREAPSQVIREVVRQFGTVDIMVNNAAVGSAYSQKPLVEFDDEFWDYTIALNLTSPYYFCKAVVPIMQKKKWGRIINISSLAGRMPLIHGTAYAASKAGLIGFTRALALELAPDGITVNTICPGPVKTTMGKIRMTQDANRLGISFDEWEKKLTPPIGRLLFPDDFAGITTLLASEASSAITGQSFNVCGGMLMS